MTLIRAIVPLLCLGLILGCSRTPQLGDRKITIKATDALLTAISSQDIKLLDHASQKLDTLQKSGDLPQPAYAHLSSIVEQARDGDWKPARQKLVTFIKGQHRS